MKPQNMRNLAIAAALGALAAGAPAAAQTVEELTVMGRYGTGEPHTLSAGVSYADLDLATVGGRAELKHRIKLTARYLCNKLGETDMSSTPVPTCRAAAERDALAQADSVIAGFPARATTWVAAPVWVAPYPTGWVTLYP